MCPPDWTNDDPDDNNQRPTSGSEITRQGFQGIETQQQHETSAIAVAAAERAQIEARFILAQRFPRDWDQVAQKLRKECQRPGFAQAAIYRKPVGKKKNEQTGEWEQNYIEGMSIRFAEAALRHSRNISVSARSIYDDQDKMIVRVTVLDLEGNSTIEDDVSVQKTVESRSLKKGQKPIQVRTNSYGDTVYIVSATDDQVLNKKNALLSKSIRNGVLRLLPGDILDDCEDLCRDVAAKKDAEDPAAAKKRLFDAFAKIGVMPEQLKGYLGHTNDLSPKELAELRGIYSAIQQGDTTWNEIDAAQKPTDDKAATAQAKKVDDILAKHTQAAAQKTDKGKAKDGPSTTAPAGTETRAATGREPGDD